MFKKMKKEANHHPQTHIKSFKNACHEQVVFFWVLITMYKHMNCNRFEVFSMFFLNFMLKYAIELKQYNTKVA